MQVKKIIVLKMVLKWTYQKMCTTSNFNFYVDLFFISIYIYIYIINIFYFKKEKQEVCPNKTLNI